MDLAEATQRQLGHWRATLGSGAHRVGWKIGFNLPALQERLGLEHSVVGHLTSATLIGADGNHSLSGARHPLAEPEIAVEVGPGRSIAGLAVALEVIDMDRVPERPDQVGDVVSLNIFHRAFAIGSSQGHSAEGVKAAISLNGEVRGTAEAGEVDLRGTIDLVDRVLQAAGERLEAGDRIIAGTLTAPVAVDPGDRVAVELGALGRIEVAFTH